MFRIPTVSVILRLTGQDRVDKGEKGKAEGGGKGQQKEKGKGAGLTVPAAWFQAAAETASPTRFRRVSTSDTVRLLWVLREESSEASPELPTLRAPCSEKYDLVCSRSE